MHLINLISILLMIWSEMIVTADVLPTCRAEDFMYSFTQCDELGGRWRVSVPNNPKVCTGGAPNAAIRVNKCYMSCDFGHFFNRTSLLCEKCSPGYYSLGGGIRIESFNSSSLPSGFRITNQMNSSSSCTGWKIVSNYVELQSNNSGDGCGSKISYTVRIVKKGKLSFKYQYLKPFDISNVILFKFEYHNYDESEVQSFDSDDYRFPTVTEQHKWNQIEVELPNPGLYVFEWKSVVFGRSNSFFSNTVRSKAVNQLFGGTGSHTDSGFIRIKNLFVDGVAFASECTACEPGSYSDTNGAKECILCPENTANAGTKATKCIECDSDTKYAPKGSEHCLEKPICGQNDYIEIESECDLTKQIQRIDYKWIEPKICRDADNVFPKPKLRNCNETTDRHKWFDSCNLGQELTDDGKCHFCEDNQYRDPTIEKCKPCPPSTSPFYALSYKVWHSGEKDDNSLPEYMSTQCIATNNDKEFNCDIAWQSNPYARHYIRTGSSTLLGSYLFLTLTVPGFRQQSGGELTFNFEIDCDSQDFCIFIFMVTKRNTNFNTKTDIVKEWDQHSSGIKSYRYRIEQNDSLAFSWIFQRNQSFQSNAKIYEITVTNPSVGSAIKCDPCPHSNVEYCIPCPFGQYFETFSENKTERVRQIESIRSRNRLNTKVVQKCKQCPKNSVINADLAFPIGAKNSCIECGPSLTDFGGISCYSDCRLHIDGDLFDLSQLKQPLIYRSGQQFTAGGIQYFHLFNITLCGRPDPKSQCVSNQTAIDLAGAAQEEYSIPTMICRLTILTDKEKPIVAQAYSLGDQLIGITRSTTYQNISVHPEFQTVSSDLHFYYMTYVPTTACLNGRALTLSLRCAPELDQTLVISTPKSCPFGTCDGCNFHFLVRTKTAAACRLCRTSDYETVVGECVEGVQQIHLVNPKGCIISADGQSKVESRHCSVIPRQVQMGIALVSAIGVLLLVLVFHFWKKNRSLEYKYCKLIEGNEKSAECCAEDEDEEEDNDNDDHVMIHPKKPKEVYEEGYETIQLTKHNTNMI